MGGRDPATTGDWDPATTWDRDPVTMGDQDPVTMGDQDPTHTGTEEVGEVLLQQLQQGLLLDGVIGSRVFVKQVDQG